MGVYVCIWVFMDIYEYLWMFMDFWVSKGFYECL